MDKLKYCFDIDGVISNQTFKHDYWNYTPVIEVINKINKLYDDGHYILLYTARGTESGIDWYQFTLTQMNNWGVKYHKLMMGKPSYDIIIDDKAINIKDWL